MAKEQENKVKLPDPNIRPDSIITQADALMLDVYILTGMKWADVWMLFKGKTGTKVSNSAKASQFLGLHDVKIYIEERCKQLNAYIDKKPETKKDKPKNTEEDMEYIAHLMFEYAKDPSNPVHFDALKAVFPKIMNYLGTDAKQEPPKRYIAATCSNCRYRQFCEQECVDECEKCRYKEYANEHGVVYTPQNQLNK